jgi:hypothetical protein
MQRIADTGEFCPDPDPAPIYTYSIYKFCHNFFQNKNVTCQKWPFNNWKLKYMYLFNILILKGHPQEIL